MVKGENILLESFQIRTLFILRLQNKYIHLILSCLLAPMFVSCDLRMGGKRST